MANKRIIQALMGAAVMMSAGSANAAHLPKATYFDFSGTCTDCSGVGKGVLGLNNYTYGSPIDSSNFLFFQYDGSDLQSAFVINDPSSVAGSISGPGKTMDFVYLQDSEHYFFSAPNGYWSLGNGSLAADYGSNGTFSSAAAAPEPGTWALMILGLGAIGFAARRRRSVTTRVRFA